MSWEEFIGIHALIGAVLAWLIMHWRTRFAIPFAIMMLYLIPYIWYELNAQNSANPAEFSAWSLLFIVPAWLLACLVFAVVRLGYFFKNRK
ncbi:hypothetical protein [Wielerella bovis]|uniref:hypothetical protein n=1 Tax=Wielerella bovis TaxID=2917790 RepID=UPI0020196CEF|nr:hypothetical protein [Wielerella bovis]MCG7657552.1 hypothetical protein [Wielerella bovis]MCG7659773.1 hypothetical protein [Wielerella bovis]